MATKNTKPHTPSSVGDSALLERPPIVVIMGHIDHGKSTLLDYIRKSNVVSGEAGGITQHLSAYEVTQKDGNGVAKKITFLDTPGHQAFAAMRNRGAVVADIAILIVSAEDSVKAQTIEALNTILEAKIPYIVAINKVDRPGANVEKTKIDLAEKGVYLEGYGGNIPSAEISAKVGTGVDHLLELILLVAELEEFKANPDIPASGIVIESHLDTKRGVSATMVIKDGTLRKGMYVVVEGAIVGTRIVEDVGGKPVSDISFSSPVKIVGFDKSPAIGATFQSYESKKEAEVAVKENLANTSKNDVGIVLSNSPVTSETKLIPIIIKTDVAGTGEAIEKEVRSLGTPEIACKLISRGVGLIGENDLRQAASDKEAIIIGFNVKLESGARDANETLGVTVQLFDIIYKLSEWLSAKLETRRPKKEIAESSGRTKILKLFNATRDRQVVGGRVESGNLTLGGKVKIIRRDFEIGQGIIVGLEQGKVKTKEVEEGKECGILIETKFDVAPGDILESFTLIQK